jgi:DNA mismatch repair ATPase MutS
MKALLMHPNRDFELPLAATAARDARRPGGDRDGLMEWRSHRDRDGDEPQLLPHEQALIQDLELNTLLHAMAGGDEFLLEVARHALLSGLHDDAEAVLYRQEALRDCLANPAIVRQLYAIAVEALEGRRKSYSAFSRLPSSILYESIRAMQMFTGMLKKVREIAAAHAGRFGSRGFRALLTMVQRELSDEYFAAIQAHLADLTFSRGMLLTARLGAGNAGADYVLRQAREPEPTWYERMIGKRSSGYTFHIHERDEAGARILSELQGRGINQVANALAQSDDHILSFFDMLRTELAFYVGCLNLSERLQPLGGPTCFPRPEASATRRSRCEGLYDIALALSMGHGVVGNGLNADGKSLLIITGANQGGKSTFLRALGQAQLMMQCGMFVAADSFAAELCSGLFTHYKREEDASMTRGKLDEELARMTELVDLLSPNAVILFNESFASTNEREGSEIARQVVTALIEKGIRVMFVTHLSDFARGMFDRRRSDTLFLRAERRPDGVRTFKLLPGEPLETSFGEDVYREVFGDSSPVDSVDTPRWPSRQPQVVRAEEPSR